MYAWERGETAGTGNERYDVTRQSKEASTKITLKNVPWIPGLPCRLLNTRTIRRDGEESMTAVRRRATFGSERTDRIFPSRKEIYIYIDPVEIRTRE